MRTLALAAGIACLVGGGIGPAGAQSAGEDSVAGAIGRAAAQTAGTPKRPVEKRARAAAAATPGSSTSASAATKTRPTAKSTAAAAATSVVASGPAPDAGEAKADVPAKALFGSAASPAPLAARAIGFYSRGCLAGAVEIPIDGSSWQVMRLSRNRNWGHPNLIRVVERLAKDGAEKDGWRGLLVGDISQPRGGPMLTGHNSHQIGLDADVWLTPMPDRRLSKAERENLSATSMLGPDKVHADPAVFTKAHAAIIRRAASYPQVERVLVHPGIKKAMCAEAGVDKRDFHKIRPFWGHHYHMHIRINCPKDSAGCKPQPPTPDNDGCGKEIDDWITLLQRPPKPVDKAAKPTPPPKPVTLADLPPECRTVIAVGSDDGKKAKTMDKTSTAGQR
jgi:penicillin-insensitive murein endopeptidase